MNGDDLKFKPHTFDVVLSFDVLEHIPNTHKHLQEVNRVLTSEGTYYFQTPNKLTNKTAEFIWKTFTHASRWDKETHCSLQTYSSLKKILKHNGFILSFEWFSPVTPHTINRIKQSFGIIPTALFKLFPWKFLPKQLQTNFYVIAKKSTK